MNIKEIAKEINKEVESPIAFVGEDRGKVEAVSTGILPLDALIGIGGLPKGRIIEIHSLQSVGKTSLCLAIISHFQKLGLGCAFVDAEYSWNYDHAKIFGVDTDKLLLLQADTGDQAFDAMEQMIRGKQIQLIVVDSISALVPRPDAEADHGKNMIGAQAKLISKGLAKIVGPLNKSGAIVIFINQLRMNIMGGQYDPYVLPGGLALRFYSSVMLELHRKGALVSGENQVGIEIEIKVKKNKVGVPGGKCSVQLMYSSGFSQEADILDMAEKLGKIKIEGKTYWFGDKKLGVGQAKARKFLEGNPEIMAQIKEILQPTQTVV